MVWLPRCRGPPTAFCRQGRGRGRSEQEGPQVRSSPTSQEETGVLCSQPGHTYPPLTHLSPSLGCHTGSSSAHGGAGVAATLQMTPGWRLGPGREQGWLWANQTSLQVVKCGVERPPSGPHIARFFFSSAVRPRSVLKRPRRQIPALMRPSSPREFLRGWGPGRRMTQTGLTPRPRRGAPRHLARAQVRWLPQERKVSYKNVKRLVASGFSCIF